MRPGALSFADHSFFPAVFHPARSFSSALFNPALCFFRTDWRVGVRGSAPFHPPVMISAYCGFLSVLNNAWPLPPIKTRTIVRATICPIKEHTGQEAQWGYWVSGSLAQDGRERKAPTEEGRLEEPVVGSFSSASGPSG